MGSLNDWSKMNLPRIGADGRPVGEPTAPVSQFPADRSPVDDALDRLERGYPMTDADLAAVRSELQRLREERDAARGALEAVRRECDLPEHIAEIVGDVLATFDDAVRGVEVRGRDAI